MICSDTSQQRYEMYYNGVGRSTTEVPVIQNHVILEPSLVEGTFDS